MNKFINLVVVLSVFSASLGGCGETYPPEAKSEGDVAASAAATGGMPADWNATDACTILDKSVVAAVMKTEISESRVSMVHEPNGAEAATSACNYLRGDGASMANIQVRWSPIGDNTPETMALTKKTTFETMNAFTEAKIEDIPNLGISAFLVPRFDQLTVFIDKARMITVTVEKVPDGASGKDIAIELARKAGA